MTVATAPSPARLRKSTPCSPNIFQNHQVIQSRSGRPPRRVISLDSYQYIDNNQSMNRLALITGATRNLGFSLVQDLARRLEPADVVYLTGRDPTRVAQSMKNLTGAKAQVRGEVLDVSKRDAVERFACELAGRHGGVDIVLSNHYTRVQPEDNPAEVIDYYVEA